MYETYLSVDVLDIGAGVTRKPEALRSFLHHQEVGTIGTEEVHYAVGIGRQFSHIKGQSLEGRARAGNLNLVVESNISLECTLSHHSLAFL